ncbi:MAG TPA: methyltransferase domain-containing protein [Cellvibrionaceae bacterium]
MATCHLYEDLSRYYDQFCQHIPYAQQAHTLYRLAQLFNDAGGNHYLDIACGTGQLIEHAQAFGWQITGLDNSANMLAQAAERCPSARWQLADMAAIAAQPQYDFASCLLYSMHYNADVEHLAAFFKAVWHALKPGGFLVFDCVDKRGIDNSAGITTYYQQSEQQFTFNSRWAYPGDGNYQTLHLSIRLDEKGQIFTWQDEHPMVAVDMDELDRLLRAQGFTGTFFERNFEQLIAWQGDSFNILVVAQKPL